jgi:lipoate-protein ligase A
VGGTASAAGKNVLLFHGTLLVDTDLMALRDSLAAHDDAYKPGSVRSVPSTVVNLADLVPGLTVESLAATLSMHLAGSASVTWQSLINANLVEALTHDLSSDAWIYDRSVQLSRGDSMTLKPALTEMKGKT